MNVQASCFDNKNGNVSVSTRDKSEVEKKRSGLTKPVCAAEDKSHSNQNNNVINNITSEKNVSILNIVVKNQSSGSDSKNVRLYRNAADNLQCGSGLLASVQNSVINNSDDPSGVLDESVKGSETHADSAVSHGSVVSSHCNIVPSHDNVITSHDNIITSQNNAIFPHVSVKFSFDCFTVPSVPAMEEDKKVHDVIRLRYEDPKHISSSFIRNHYKSNMEGVMPGDSKSCDGREFPNLNINDVNDKKKAHLTDDAGVAYTSSNNGGDDGNRESLIKDLKIGVDQDDSSNNIVPNKASIISHLAEQDDKKEQITEDFTSVDRVKTAQITRPTIDAGCVGAVRRHKVEKISTTELASDDSSDEDIGIYAESFRCSDWVCIGQEDILELKTLDLSSQQSLSSSPPVSPMSAATNHNSNVADDTDGKFPSSPTADEVFSDPLCQAVSQFRVAHKHSDSTASEIEFRHHYMSRRKCLIQRADSQQEYHRLSSRMYDQDRQVIIERISSCEDFGLHLLDSYPAFITSVDPGSAAEKAGITEGQILVSVNDQNVLTTNHAAIVKLIQSLKGSIKLGVANSDFQPVRDLQAAVMSGYMYKLGNSAFKMWKKRYFILRQDNCLYYYRNHQETDPLGAFPLGGYTICRHTDTNREFCFKAEKFGGRTYYLSADSRDQMTVWVGALTEASLRSKKRKESFLSVSTHNVGLPALHILKPECAGFLGKLSPSRRAWRHRYCVLKDACLYYYKDKSSFSALGVMHLHGYTVAVENYQRRKFSFILEPPEKNMRVFAFSADNETDKKRWIESLTLSIQRWVRADRY